MGIPTVNGTVATTKVASASSHPLNMPSGITAGELLICCIMIDRDRAITSGFTGWTQLFWYGADPNIGVYYKIAAGGETLTIGYNAATPGSYSVFRVSGQAASSFIEATANSSNTGSSTSPNSPSITPSWGTNDALFLSMFSSNTTSLTASAAPSGYTGPHPSISGSGAMAYKGVSGATSEDPDAFTTDISSSWRSATIAIKGGVTAYTLAVGAGSYILTGIAAALNPGKTMIVDAGAYVLSGIAALFHTTRTVVAGAYSYTGIDVMLRYGYLLVADAGAYVLTGVAALFHATMFAVTGAYTYTGVDVTLNSVRSMIAAAGSYALNGMSVTLQKGLNLIVGTGSYVLTGLATILARVSLPNIYERVRRNLPRLKTAPRQNQPNLKE